VAQTLSPNMEMYLKTILEIAEEGQQPRVKSIAQRLGVTMPSVSGAVETLIRKGLVTHNPYREVVLTHEGMSEARRVKDRNDLLYRFLREVLGIPEPTARADACTLEHVVSRESLDRLELWLQFMDVCPLGVTELVRHFRSWADSSTEGTECHRCVSEGSGPRCVA
jgi:DtxR family Mn-dependent transcriptional regulator